MADGNLQSLGQLLREAREARALDLDEVEMQTRIRAKYIQALETGNLSILPSATHAKGFLRNYATFLQLDVNHVMNQFSAMTGAGPMPATAAPPRPPSDEPATSDARVMLPTETPPQTHSVHRSTYVTPKDRVGPAVPRGVGSGTKQPTNPRQQAYQQQVPVYTPPQPQEAPSRESRLKGAPGKIIRSPLFTVAILLVGFIMIVWWSTTQLSQVSIDPLIPTQQESNLFDDVGTPEPELTFEATATQAQATSRPVVLDRVLLKITVHQRSWVRIVVDGEEVFEGQADPNKVFNYDAEQQITVRAGNAAGLEINYNGQDMGVLGGRGEIIEQTYTVTGDILTPTGTPTITPTPTSVPSPTPRT